MKRVLWHQSQTTDNSTADKIMSSPIDHSRTRYQAMNKGRRQRRARFQISESSSIKVEDYLRSDFRELRSNLSSTQQIEADKDFMKLMAERLRRK